MNGVHGPEPLFEIRFTSEIAGLASRAVSVSLAVLPVTRTPAIVVDTAPLVFA